MKNIFLAQAAYAMDYKWYAPGTSPAIESWNQQYWQHKLRGYLGDKRIPTSWSSSREMMRSGVFACDSLRDVGTHTYAYSLNAYEHLGTAPFSMSHSKLLFSFYRILRPETKFKNIPGSKVLFISEMGHDYSLQKVTPMAIRNKYEFDGRVSYTPDFRHVSTKNMIMFDGHLDSIARGRIEYQMYVK